MPAKMLLVLSTGRTGTRFIYEYFHRQHHDRVRAFHASRYSTLFNILSNLSLEGLLPAAVIPYLWRSLKGRELQSASNWLLDSNNHLYAMPTVAPELFSDLHIVHVVRDPRDYVRSHINWSHSRRKSLVANYLLPFWQPNGAILGSRSWRDWPWFSLFDRLAWVWQYKNDLIGTYRAQHPYLLVRFEDLVHPASGTAEMHRIEEFMDLPVRGEAGPVQMRAVNQSGSSHLPHWTQWPPAMCLGLQRACERGMLAHGYGGEPEWAEKLRLAVK